METEFKLSSSTLKKLLSSYIDFSPYGTLWRPSSKKKLIGTVTNDEWELYLKTFWRNSDKPEVTIRFNEIENNKTGLVLEFRPFWYSRLFYYGWELFIPVSFFGLLIHRGRFDPGLFLLPLFGGSVLLMKYLGFQFGHRKLSRHLEIVFNEIKQMPTKPKAY